MKKISPIIAGMVRANRCIIWLTRGNRGTVLILSDSRAYRPRFPIIVFNVPRWNQGFIEIDNGVFHHALRCPFSTAQAKVVRRARTRPGGLIEIFSNRRKTGAGRHSSSLETEKDHQHHCAKAAYQPKLMNRVVTNHWTLANQILTVTVQLPNGRGGKWGHPG